MAKKMAVTKRLTRDFIHDALYNLEAGYFSIAAKIISPRQPIEFTKLADQHDYQRQVHSLYSSTASTEAWHTPAEIFQPHYGNAVARCISESLQPHQDPLIIVEAGGGNGTLMSTILSFLRLKLPEVYKTTQYHLVDISAEMLRQQQARGRLDNHSEKLWFHHHSFLNWDWQPDPKCYCVVLATEVLDNLAHDRLAFDSKGQLCETVVCSNSSGYLWEELRPVDDPLICEFLQLRKNFKPKKKQSLTFWQQLRQSVFFSKNDSVEFIPTESLLFLRALSQIPHNQFIAADFHYLPDTIGGRNAPVVQRRSSDGAGTVTLNTYLVLNGQFDIFFPTDFDLLAKAYQVLCGRAAKVFTQPAFMKMYADLDQTRTRSGYNPLVEDYQNVSFIVA